MSKDRSAPAEVIQAGEIAKEDTLAKHLVDILMNTDPAHLIRPTATAERVKGNSYRTGCWGHAPAMFQFFANTDRRLTRVARMAGINVTRVERIHASLIPYTRLILIQAAPLEDLSATRVTRYNNCSWANLFDLLAEANLTLETGYKTRFDVAYVPKGSKLWPGLLIDLDQPLERKVETSGKKKKTTNSEAPAAKAPESKAPEAK